MQRAASASAAKYGAGARTASTPVPSCTHCSHSYVHVSCFHSYTHSHTHSYIHFYACTHPPHSEAQTPSPSPHPYQACAAFRLAVGSGARLSPKYSAGLEQLAAAVHHCELQCMAPLELLFAELILGQAEAQRLADDAQSEGLQAACKGLRLFLPEYLDLLDDPRLMPCRLVPLGKSAAVAAAVPTREQACEAFRRAIGGGARLHPSYSIDLAQLALALGHCGLCSDDLRGLLATHARRCPPRLFVSEFLGLLGLDLTAPAVWRLAAVEPAAKPAKPAKRAAAKSLRSKMVRAFTPPPLRTHRLSDPPSPTTAAAAAAAATAAAAAAAAAAATETAFVATLDPRVQLRPSERQARMDLGGAAFSPHPHQHPHLPPLLQLHPHPTRTTPRPSTLTFIFDLTPTLTTRSPASRRHGSQAHAGFMAAAGTAPRLHPAYSLGVAELGLALTHCGMRPLHSALATTSSSEKA